MDKFNAIIDTIQIRTGINNVNYEEMDREKHDFILKQMAEPKCGIKDSEMNIPISLNRIEGHYYRIETLSEHKKALDIALDKFGVKKEDKPNINLNRVDIALDTDLDFDDNFKYFLYLFELVTYGDKKADKWYTTNLNTLKNNTIKQLGRYLEIVFYDKADESNDRHLYNTRQEFRYKQLIGVDSEEVHFEKLIALISSINVNIELLDKNMSNRIIKKYDAEMKKGNIKSLSEFVRMFDKYIYTNTIMENLYIHSGLKDNYSNWIRNFRRTSTIEFFTVNTIKTYQADAIRSLKQYKNS